MTDTTFTQGTIIEPTWLQDANDHVNDKTGIKHAASKISNTPAGNISATTVQAAINELDSEKQASNANLTALNTTASQAEMEAGSLTTVRAMSPKLVLDAINYSATKYNYFHNPEMSVQQRPALTPSNSRKIGQVDRWAYQVGNASFTATAGSLGGVTIDNRQVLNATVQFTAANAHIFDQRLPAKDCWKFGDKAITVSAYVFQNSGASQSWYWEIDGANSVDNFFAKTTHATGSASPVTVPTGVWTRVTFTTTLTNSQVANGLEFRVRSTSTAAGSSHNVRLKDCQLEFGSTATTFSSRSYDEELAICRRFWRTSYLPGVNPGTADPNGALAFRQVIASETDHTGLREYFGIPMAKDPAITWYNPNSGAAGSLYDYSGGANRTISATYRKSVYSTGYPGVSPGAGVAGAYCLVHYVSDAEL